YRSRPQASAHQTYQLLQNFIAQALDFSIAWFHFSDTWQLVINTATTIMTFLMVFPIQNSQNRASAAIQLKLDELIRTPEVQVQDSKKHTVRRFTTFGG